MKILWLVNIIMPDLSKALGRDKSVHGGWLTGALGAVRESGNGLVVCTVEKREDVLKEEANGVTYYVVPQGDIAAMRASFQSILDSEKPDVVHIYGTEFPQTLAMTETTYSDRMIVTIQGYMDILAKNVFAGIPDSVCKDNRLHRFLRRIKKGGESIELQRFSFAERAGYEAKALDNVGYINGGSQWGNRCGRIANPNANILDCSLILRDSFYGCERWDYDKCDKHTVYTTYRYPIKGFHKFLEALAIIVKRFPDTKVYVASDVCSFRDYKGIKRRIMDKAPDYAWYVQGLIEKYGLSGNLVFLGHLSEEKVHEYLLKSNVFVSPSAIENQSTALGEAMMIGVPSVASCVGAIPEMIDNGVDGFTYPFNEPEMLAYYVMRLFGDGELCKYISEKGIAHALRTYDRKKNMKDLIAMYERVDSDFKGGKTE